ncbi:hypothetical protein [Kitasatospora sp. NPDC002040]|uniref:hypothetical protein n=1 Tax=Kitasatospora sp. NPDC002040 TaxID=3154661 RepID=UPI0033189AFF
MHTPSTLITSRPLDEYCALFGLTRAALAAVPGPVLDCPGGAAGLTAEARELGVTVIAADPAYAAPLPELTALARAGRDSMAARLAVAPERHLPAPHLRPERYLRSWDRARRLFAADSTAHPERYVAGVLPRLPFADGSFALTLSAYLLFAYPGLFPPERQLAGLLELVRVTAPAGEVRVYPLHDGDGRPCPHLSRLRAALGERQVSTEVSRFPRPGDGRTRRVLILRRSRVRRARPGSAPGPGPGRTAS